MQILLKLIQILERHTYIYKIYDKIIYNFINYKYLYPNTLGVKVLNHVKTPPCKNIIAIIQKLYILKYCPKFVNNVTTNTYKKK